MKVASRFIQYLVCRKRSTPKPSSSSSSSVSSCWCGRISSEAGSAKLTLLRVVFEDRQLFFMVPSRGRAPSLPSSPSPWSRVVAVFMVRVAAPSLDLTGEDEQSMCAARFQEWGGRRVNVKAARGLQAREFRIQSMLWRAPKKQTENLVRDFIYVQGNEIFICVHINEIFICEITQ